MGLFFSIMFLLLGFWYYYTGDRTGFFACMVASQIWAAVSILISKLFVQGEKSDG